MSTSTNSQALVAAFAFGLVVHAAASTVPIVYKGCSNILRDGPRLALITFLISSALWAQLDFTSFMINAASTGCQVTITFASIFDQFARVSLQQSLIWTLNKSTKGSGVDALASQGFVLVRLILGGVFVGFQRPQLGDICLARTSVLPIGVVVSAVDLVFVAALLTRVISHGNSWEGVVSGRAALFITVGLGIWTAASVPLMLGIETLPVVVRTVIPATGLSILIGRLFFLLTNHAYPLAIIAHFQGRFAKSEHPTEPAFDAYRHLQSRGISTADSYHPTQHEEVRREVWEEPKRIPRAMTTLNKELPVISMPAAGQATLGMGGVPVQGQLFPPPRAQTLPLSIEMKSLEKRPRQDTKLVISNPILRQDHNPLSKIATVDLAVAQKERKRQEALLVAVSDTESSYAPTSKPTSIATTTSALLSPGVEEVRRRSPRQPSTPNLSNLKPPPRHLPYPSRATRETVVNFSLPVDAQKPATRTPRAETKSAPPIKPKDRDIGELPRITSVVHRPRPIPRKPNVDRPIFPAEGTPDQHRKRSLSCSSILKLETPPPIPTDPRLSEFANLLGSGHSKATGTRRRSMSVPELPILSLASSPAKVQPVTRPESPAQSTHSISPSDESIPTPSSLRKRGYERRSSPVLPAEGFDRLSPGSTIADDDSFLNWDIAPTHVQEAGAVKSTKIQRAGLGVAGTPSLSEAHGPLHEPAKQGTGLASDLQGAEDLNSERTRQVGEARPTFSDRGRSVKLHRSPPPAPLLLRNSRVQAEPSPDSEDELEMALARSGSNVNPAELAGAFSGDERATLLANLELELNEQENQWQAIRHTMLRDSLSTVSMGSPRRDSRHGQPFRRTQLEAENDLQSLLSQTGFRSKLASSSFPGLSSPTPPDTESEHEYDEESEVLVGQMENDAKAAKALWRPITPVASAPSAPSLWTPASKAADMAPEEIPDTIRREKRYLEPLTIESNRLWEASRSPERQVASQGLWRADKTQVVEVKVQHSAPPRQPPRRIKRVTLLPDILENPEPLPDRRGTLGIFQFPWGERSDRATMPAMPTRGMSGLTIGAMPGTMASRGSQSQSHMQRSVEFSDSETYDDSSSYYDSDEEGFDETTLWEIVSLLEPAERTSESTTGPHYGKSGLHSEQKQEAAHGRAEQVADEDANSAKFSDNGNNKGQAPTNISSSHADSPPKTPAGPDQDQISQRKSPHPPMTLADMDLRERVNGKEREDEGQSQGRDHNKVQNQGPAKIDAHLIAFGASSAPDAAMGTPPKPEPPVASISKNPPERSISSAPVPRPLSGAPINDDSTTHETHPPNCPPSPLSPPPSIYKADAPTQISTVHQQSTSIFGMALWSPSPIVHSPTKGLAQPDEATWKKYLPTDDTARVLPAKADLPIIESNTLWTPPAKKVDIPNHGLWGTKTPLPGMWSQPPVLPKVSYGLPQPDPETWATYLVVMDDVPRVKTREAEPASVESSSLWSSKPVIPEVPSEDGLWSGSSSASSASSVSGSESSTGTPSEAVNFGLWEPTPAIIADEEPTGLFSLSHRRTEYRTTDKAPAALEMRPPRRPLEAYPDFGFTHLWNMAPLWDAKANASAVELQRELDGLVLEGLFSLKHRRNNFRTTSEPPAALETRPKMRISQEPLPTLSSDSLWSVRAPAETSVELDWMALSTVRPRTTSVASEDSLISMPPLTRASSIKSDKSVRRIDATPAEWLAALDDAIRASGPSDKGAMDLDPSETNYQLWSKSDEEPLIMASDSDELWKPTSIPTPRFLELTPSLRDYDKKHAESGTSHRGRTLAKSRPPPPIYPGSSTSAFLPAASDTPRDFASQGLWARGQSPAGSREDGSWLDKSLRKSLSFVQLW
ncbi:uncharacterized protein NECHADRAFT_103549 [Fusarium vanettenii 77-13-4]|uniref:Uncharacterized protein n=1 Tax=Fusarium vanettenii (strain ATCC MYA-4622 / CBS 123669 / FGSC 9596 / NRRL 45880 / 77-13-4) TaxID=660122 RepID=C7Z5A0_FUSV7|nr:uncharacterized protein NECHADRAFT_103549 [Fusarium vanettenii 77-13-4]EEU40486.1 hypothetical protein NECHADRAFT_103549 [Fusarium vanettenii 77-13-4]